MFKKSSTDKKQDKMTDSSFIRIIMTSILGVAMCILCLCSSTWAWFSHSISSENTNKITAANDFNLKITVTYDSSSINNVNGASLLSSEDDDKGSASVDAEGSVPNSTETEAGNVTEGSENSSTEKVDNATGNSPNSSTEKVDDSTKGNGDSTESTGNTSNGQTSEDQNNASDSSTIVMDLIANVKYTVTLELPKGSASGYCVINIGGTNYYSPYIARHESDTPKTVSFTLICLQDQSGVTFTPCWGIYSGDASVADKGTLTITAETTAQQ